MISIWKMCQATGLDISQKIVEKSQQDGKWPEVVDLIKAN